MGSLTHRNLLKSTVKRATCPSKLLIMFKYFALASAVAIQAIQAAEPIVREDVFKAFAAPPIAKGTPKICSDDCYPVGTVVQAAFDAAGEEFPEQFQYHGCYCPRLFGNPNFLQYISQGCEPSYELSAEDPNDLTSAMTCIAKGVHVSEACGQALCQLDLDMAKTIMNFIEDNTIEQSLAPLRRRAFAVVLGALE